MQIVAIGEILWDMFPASEILGGAPLNFSAAARRLGSQVALLTAVGKDQRGIRAIQSMSALGLSTAFVHALPAHATGTAVVTTDSQGKASYFIQRPAAFDEFELSETRLAALVALQPAWLYFGTLAQTDPRNESTLSRILQRMPALRCFYDMNLRDGHWNLPLVQRLSHLAAILKLNDDEAETLFTLTHPGQPFSLGQFCRHWSQAYGIETICITLGAAGCAIFQGDSMLRFPGFTVQVADTVGSGDAFAAAFLHGFTLGWPAEEIATFANALGALVASRPGATPFWTVDECRALIAAQRT